MQQGGVAMTREIRKPSRCRLTWSNFGRTLTALAAFGFMAIGTGHNAMAAPTVTIAQGTLTGVDANGISAFLGVRYALPTQRWRPPAAVGASGAKLDASKPGADCAQGPSPWG